MSVWDAAIIGGGPAGSSLAMFLARAGQKVVVCECDRLPRDKLCGEFLSGESRRLLEQLGCLGEIEAVRPAVIDRCRFTAPCGATCETALPSQAFGISRRALDRILLRHAERSGATVVEGARASALEEQDNGDARVDLRLDHGAHDSLSARIVVGAHGRREPIDRELDRAFLRRRHPYVGLKRHHRPRASGASLRELDGYVEVHAFDGGYCGLSRIEGGEVNVCMLVREAFLGGLPSPRWHDVRDAVCRANRILASRLDALHRGAADYGPSDTFA